MLALTKKFITNQLEYLEFLENKMDLLKLPHMLFYNLLIYCLKYNKGRLAPITPEKYGEVVGVIQDF